MQVLGGHLRAVRLLRPAQRIAAGAEVPVDAHRRQGAQHPAPHDLQPIVVQYDWHPAI